MHFFSKLKHLNILLSGFSLYFEANSLRNNFLKVLEEVGRRPQKSRNEILSSFRKPQIPFSLTMLHISFWNSTLTY